MNMKTPRYLIGIIGGLGPYSHIDFEKRIIDESTFRGAKKDQQHPPWILVNIPQTPDRTKALFKTGDNPVPYLIKAAKILESAGAAAFFVVCNTADAFRKQVQKTVSIPWISFMEIVADKIIRDFKNINKVGVLGTNGTIQAGLYPKTLSRFCIDVISPKVGDDIQNKVMEAIYNPDFGVKASGTAVSPYAFKLIMEGVNWCIKRGAQIIIPACTEISVVLNPQLYKATKTIDPLDCASQVFLDLTFGTRNPEDFLVRN